MWAYIIWAGCALYAIFLVVAIRAIKNAPYMEEIQDEPAPDFLIKIFRQKSLSERLKQREQEFDDYIDTLTQVQRRIEREAVIRQVENGELK